MEGAGDRYTSLDGNSVRRWEAGERWPEPRFRQYLVTVFEKPASELGLLTREELAARPVDHFEERPEKRDTLSRHAFLRGVLGMGLSSVLVPLLGGEDVFSVVEEVARRGMRPGTADVRTYGEIADRQRQLYWTSEAALMFEASLAHTQLGLRMVAGTTPEVRQQLMPALAQSALLAGRIAFFDLQQSAVAERCFSLARQAVREAADHALAVSVLAHSSFVPGFSGQLIAATRLLDGATGHVRTSGGPRLRAWLHCVQSEVATRCGDPLTGVAKALQAEDSLATSGDDPEWLDFFDPARLASFRGYAEMLAGRPGAIETLEGSLLQLETNATRQRTVVLLDLAAAHAPSDPEHAADLAEEAFRILAGDPYATAFGRIPLLLSRLQEDRHRRLVDEHFRELTRLWD